MSGPEPRWKREQDRRRAARNAQPEAEPAAGPDGGTRQVGWHADPDNPGRERFWDPKRQTWSGSRSAKDAAADRARDRSANALGVVVGLAVVAAIVGVIIWIGSNLFSGGDSDSDPGYRDLTCAQWRKLANDDSKFSDALDIALKYAEAVKVVPDGADGTAEFADVISGACGPTRLNNTKIYALRANVRDVYVQLHPNSDAS